MTEEMKLTLRHRLENAGTRTLAREELRRRILAIVEAHGELSDGAIWQHSGPEYLPWNLMLAELRALSADCRLGLEIVAPGHWIVRSLVSVQQAQAGPARRSEDADVRIATAAVKPAPPARRKARTRSGKAG